MINAVVDLSHYNSVSSFDDVKSDGILGVIHKATQGISYQDPAYQSCQEQALAAGLFWGAYHFGTGDDPVSQAEYFLSFVNPKPTDLLALDFEENPNGSSMTLADAEQFVTTVQQATGRWPGLYGGGYLKGLLGNDTNPTLANCWFWLAEYGPTPEVPPNWPTWTMWQYTDTGTVDGIEGNCDRDQFNGDVNGLMKLWGYLPE